MPSLRRKSPRPLPTDRDILEAVYERHYEEFAEYSKVSGLPRVAERETKNYVPVDIDGIARQFGVDADLVFGRLYYHLENRYGYKRDDGGTVPFFTLGFGKSDRHCVNFPYMASVLADLRDQDVKHTKAIRIAWFSLAVSILVVVVAFFKG